MSTHGDSPSGLLMSCKAIASCHFTIPKSLLIAATNAEENYRMFHMIDPCARGSCIRETFLDSHRKFFSGVMFREGMGHLAVAKIKPRHLQLGAGFRGFKFEAATPPPYRGCDVDLGELESFTYDTGEGYDRIWPYDLSLRGVRGMEGFRCDFEEILKRSCGGIQNLHLRGGPYVEWPIPSSTLFTCLKRLTLATVMLPSGILAADILQRFPALEEISFENCIPWSDQFAIFERWKTIFEALKSHPNAIRVNFTSRHDGFNVCFDPKCDYWSNEHGSADKYAKSLWLYLANQGEWDENLEQMFPPEQLFYEGFDGEH